MKKIVSILLSASLCLGGFSGMSLGTAAAGTGTSESGKARSTGSLCVSHLTVDHLTEPMGIDSETPVFSWQIADDAVRAWKQTAYRITVADSEQALSEGTYVWDSTQIASDETVDIPYDGAALAPATRYYWQVSVTGKNGENAVSDVAWFETGLMDSGWSDAKWIARSEPKSDAYFSLTDFTLDFDYAITANAASILFGGTGDGDFYMWQISAFSWHSDLRLRPHKCTSGGFAELPSATLAADKSAVGSWQHMTIQASDGTVKTYLDGVLKDTRTIADLELGYIGFRCAGSEGFKIDNIVVKDGSGTVVLDADFDNGDSKGFEKSALQNGELVFDSSALSGSIFLRKFSGEVKAESAPMLRKAFSTAEGKAVERARLYVTAAGLYDAYINGERVTDTRLNPGMTAYDDHILYQTYDVTNLVKEGENVIGAYLGHGWFNKALRNFGTTLCLYAKLVVTYADGTSDTVVTDDSWRFFRYGPILDDDIFNGFKYDALTEKALDGWNCPGYDDSAWEDVSVIAPNKIVNNGQTPAVIAQNLPPIRNTVELPALSVSEPKEGVYVYDFGQNIAGVVRITASAPAGTTVTMRHAEILNRENMAGADDDPGMIFTGNLPRADATDTYVFRGDKGEETFEPFFVYHGFRYVEITGLDEPLPLENVTALLITSDLEQTGSFESSNALVNRLYLNSLWSARDNFMSVPTDCPQRGERFGWTGDAQIFARTGSYLMDVNAFYQKYCMDMRDTSKNNRIIADVAPASSGAGWYGSGDRKEATNGYGDAIIIIPYQMYKQYGNRAVLEENYEIMCNWMDYLVSTSTDYIRDQSWTGDWLPVNEPKSPVALTDTAFCAYSASLLAEISDILGETAKAEEYRALYNSYRTAWRAKFLTGGEGGKTACGTQTSYVLGIKFGLFDEDEIPAAAENLVKNIKAQGWHLTTGFLGLSYLNPVLSDTGYSEVAYRLLEQEEYPSWLYSVTTGSTTIWESWYAFRLYEDGSSKMSAESLNHFSYGAVTEWLYRYVLGIERDDADEASVGFKHFLLKPQFGGSFTYANGSYDSVRGTVESGWTLNKETGAFTYHAVVPANTTATLYLPVKDADTAVLESGVNASDAEGVTLVGYADGCMIYELGSGSYDFSTTVNPNGNAVTSVKVTDAQEVDASLTMDGTTYTSFPQSVILSMPEVTLSAQSDDPLYVFRHFEDAQGNRYENGVTVSGDNDLNMVFAYTGSDDGT
ncbi:MAG: family 78 glycoside hydrolase catalytic domain, partial [Eubacteriales bacterium]